MSDRSARLDLPFLLPAQAQKHVSHNEALQRLDGVTQMVLEARDAGDPPVAPEAGALYALGSAPSGSWAGHAGAIAQWEAGGWEFFTPQEGWHGWDRQSAAFCVFRDGAWQEVVPALQMLDGVGIGTGSDAVNRLAVASEASLLSHAGAGHQLKINKAASGDVASLLFQTGWTGHAEMGLSGDDMFRIKVSPDGSSWTEALRIDATTGRLAGQAVQQQMHDTAPGVLLTSGAFGWGQTGDTQQSADPDATLSSGVHQVGAGAANAPVDTGCALLVIRYADNWITQMAFGGAATEVFIRRSEDNGISWEDWLPLTPQHGSTADGAYTRHTDGTQVCWKSETLSVTTSPIGNIHGDQGLPAWSFPMTFSEPPAVSFSASGGGVWGSVSGAVSSTSMSRQVLSATALSGASVASFSLATGRWY